MTVAHRIHITMMNVSTEVNGVATATAFLQEVAGERLDIADVEADVDTAVSEVSVTFIVRLSENAVESVQNEDGIDYFGEV